MMNSSQNMFWSEINNVSKFTENTEENKNKKTKKTASIILAGVQLCENYIKGLKNLSAYEAASTIISDANWIQKSTFQEFKNEVGKKIPIEVGKIYYIDYGKTFYGELAYYHYGLCIGQRKDKLLVIPMTTGTNYFTTSYHPINNPKKDKKYRQALKTEGFLKNCVLKIDDTKFISAGRIEKEYNKIKDDILRDIQNQVFQVAFPNIFGECTRTLSKNNKQIKEQKELISKLKNENNHLKQLLKNNNLL